MKSEIWCVFDSCGDVVGVGTDIITALESFLGEEGDGLIVSGPDGRIEGVKPEFFCGGYTVEMVEIES